VNNFRFNLGELLKLRRSFGITNNVYCNVNYGFDKSPIKANLVDVYPIGSYECIIDETGRYGQKFFIGKELISSYYIENAKNNSYASIREHENAPPNSADYSSLLRDWSLKAVKLDEQLLGNLTELRMTHYMPFERFVNSLPSPITLKKGKTSLYMEHTSAVYDPNSSDRGYILYELIVGLPPGSLIFVKPSQIRDHALILCDYTKPLITIDSNEIESRSETISVLKLKHNCTRLHVLCESMGRASDISDPKGFIAQRKGLLTTDAVSYKRVDKNLREIGDINWKITLVDFMPRVYNHLISPSKWLPLFNNNFRLAEAPPMHVIGYTPFLTYLKFNVNKINGSHFESDRFFTSMIDFNKRVKVESSGLPQQKYSNIYMVMSNFNRGNVFLNGFNLGRYLSNFGSLCTLFVPKALLVDGENELLIFDWNEKPKRMNKLSIYVSNTHVYI
jgi:hypothetical protein